MVPSVQPIARINIPSLRSLASGVPSSEIISTPSSSASGGSSSRSSEPLPAALYPRYAASVSVPLNKAHTRGLRDLPTTKDQGKVSPIALLYSADDFSA